MANPGSLLLKLIIDGTSAGAVKALAETQAATDKTGKSLKELQALGRNALQFAGVGLGISELIQLADTYTSMTSRLKLVTQYTGDYNQVFAELINSARATRSDLRGTVDLYVQMAPALKGIGLDGKQAAGVITTINQAIGLSGASAQSASAALVQLGQGFGSGTLRGDELNSVLEQTPALAQAIADGLGVPLGELRKLGEAGELTAAKVAGALQKVAPQLEADFAKMPKTVAQSLTALKNEFLVYIGATDQANGGTSALAGAILAVSDEFKNQGPIITAVSTAISTLVNGFDGLYRMIKIVGLGLGAYAAAAKAAFSGDFSQARLIWQQLGEDIDAVLLKQLGFGSKTAESAADVAKKRASLEGQLSVQIEKLEKLRLYKTEGVLAEIAGKEKENIDKRIADQQRLVEAVKAAWQQSLKEAEAASLAAQGLLDKASAKRGSTADKVFNAESKGLSPEEQAAAATDRAQSLFDQGRYAAAASNAARLDGRFKQAEKYQKEAEAFLSRAESFADKAGNIDLIQGVGEAQARLLESQAAAEQQKADQLQKQAASQAELLNRFQAQLEALQAKARAIEIKIETEAAEEKVKGLTNQLAELKDKTVTVTLNTVSTGNAPTLDLSSYGPGDPGVSRAYGGELPGYAPHDRADNVKYWGTPGEWVIQRPSVRYYGADVIRAINERRLPKFAFGGQIGSNSLASKISLPSLSASATSKASSTTPLLLDFGKLGRYQASAESSVADEIARTFKRAALASGRR